MQNTNFDTAGFCRLDITPPLDTDMQGYFYERKAKGVHDPLYVNAVAFGNGDKHAVIMVCDLIGIYSDAARLWPQKIAKALNLEPTAVFLCHTHTHTGATVTDSNLNGESKSDKLYDEWLFRRLHDAAKMAINDCKPITAIRTWEGECNSVAFSRRFQMKDGSYQTWANYLDPNISDYACKADESLRFARIVREDDTELVIVNFQCHPDCVSTDFYSADYPGFLRNKIEKEKNNVKCLFLNGAEGQIVCNDWWHDSVIRTKYKIAIHVGEKLADVVLQHFDEATLINGNGVSFDQSEIQHKTKWDPVRMPEAERIIALHEAGRDDDIGPDWIATPLVSESYHIRKLNKEDCDNSSLTISAVTIGGLAFLGIPGEPFCEIGEYIRERSPYATTMICCQTNGCLGYFATSAAYDQGGYEPRNSPFARGVAENIMETSEQLLNKLSAK